MKERVGFPIAEYEEISPMIRGKYQSFRLGNKVCLNCSIAASQANFFTCFTANFNLFLAISLSFFHIHRNQVQTSGMHLKQQP